MGAYLSEPKTEKISSDEVGKNISYGASSMQGWRMSQEDAHNCCLNFDEDVSLFAVYDGHGGHEVASYCSKNLPTFIKNTEAYKKGDIQQALINAFLEFDATLATPEVINILKEIADPKFPDHKNEQYDSDDEENVNNLCKEATMPLDELLAKYRNKLDSEKENSASKSDHPSLYLSSQRNKDKEASSSSGAGCSSSSSSSLWNTNETDVSSSSQQCETSSSSTSNNKIVETATSSEADQILDSTTSNGDISRISQVGSSTADSETVKSSEMPDSSEDVNDKVSPSKVTHSTSNQNEAGINGKKSVKNFGDADSSKNTADDECSSSCTPLENGEAKQKRKISKSQYLGTRRAKINMGLVENIINHPIMEYSDSEEDDEENDETFDGQPDSDSKTHRVYDDYDDDDDDDDDDEDDDDEDDEDDDDDDDDDDEEKEGEEDDDEDEDNSMEINEEPGSGSGCTAVVAVLKGNELYVANAGDSRCVLCRNGEAVELSFDHKPEDQPEMERIVKAGGKVTADGRVNGGLNLSRALGDHAYKKNKDLAPEEQMISALPDIKTVTLDLEKDEFMVLACDGIWNFMSSQNVVNFIRTRIQKGYENISKICEELFDHCLAPHTCGDGTGCDNMTAIIVQFKSSKSANNASASAEVTSVTKKRPMSPSASTESNECTNNVTEDSKRFKPESC